MKPISHSLRDVLVRQGIANAKTVGAGKVRGNKSPALSTMASSGGVAADAREGGQERPPIGHRHGGETGPMGMRKSPGTAGAGSVYGGLSKKPEEPTPAVWRVLKLVVDNSRCMPLRPTRSAQRGSGIHLVLV